MLLYSVILLTSVAVILELIFVYHMPRVGMWFERNIIPGVVFSIALSAVFGSIFGAGGMIVMAAGLTSTVITAIIYKLGLVRLAWRIADWSARRRGEQSKYQDILQKSSRR